MALGLKPEVSLSVGLATAALVYGIYSNATPPITDIRASRPGDATIDASRKFATWTSAAVVAGISLVAKDPTIFILGGSMVVALDWATRHGNLVSPMTGKAAVPSSPAGLAGDVAGDPVYYADDTMVG
jgi:hypothetical protein